MKKSLLFIPDISGFTKFVQSTEIEHSHHVIAELLEIIISANEQEFRLAEIEGDALFFYKEEEIPSLEKLLAKVESVFTAFYSHLKLLEKNRICPCNACASAPNLNLKIIAHSGELQFISVQNNRKPFGTQVIEAHRLMKNSIQSDNYFLLSESLANDIEIPKNYQSKLFDFKLGEDQYDGKQLKYQYTIINQKELKLKPFNQIKKIEFDISPSLTEEMKFPIAASQLFEFITNFSYRHYLIDDKVIFKFNANEVTKIGSKHQCVIDGKNLDFVTVVKKGDPGQLIYGEMTTTPPIVDKLYSFFIVTPMTHSSCKLEYQTYLIAKSPIKKIIIYLFAKRLIKKNIHSYLDKLMNLIESEKSKRTIAS